MDPAKKRKLDENGVSTALPDPNLIPIPKLTPVDVRKLVQGFSTEQLLDILHGAVSRHVDVLNSVRSIGDRDPAQRKLFIRGLGSETTTDGLRAVFSEFGEPEEAVVVMDKVTGKSKGYGFVIFKHVDGALLALKEPSKKIDGRLTVTQLAAAAAVNSGSTQNPADVAHRRKIYVVNVPYNLSSEKLLSHFAEYGEIEEGPLGYDSRTGKRSGFATFLYKTAEGAQEALRDPIKMIDGNRVKSILALDRFSMDGVLQEAHKEPSGKTTEENNHQGMYPN